MLFGPGIFHPARVVFSVTAIPRSQRRQHHISSKKSVRILWCEGHAPTERDCERDRPPPPPSPPPPPPTPHTPHPSPSGDNPVPHTSFEIRPVPVMPPKKAPFAPLILLWTTKHMSLPATIRPNKLCQTHKPLAVVIDLGVNIRMFLKIYSTHLVWFYSDIIETLHTKLELNKTISAVTEVFP